MKSIKSLVKEDILEDRIVIFPNSKKINEVLKLYPYVEEHLCGVFDNNAQGNTYKLKEKQIPIIQYHNDVNINQDTAIIICAHHREILNQLSDRADCDKLSIYIYFDEVILKLNSDQLKELDNKKNIDKIKYLYHLVQKRCKKDKNYVERKIGEMNNKVIIPVVELILTTHCSLCCSECFAGKPYNNKCEHYEVDFIKQELNSLLECIDECIQLELIGGEPFLYPNIEEIVRYCLSLEKVEIIVITTNGTIVPNDNVMKVLQDKKLVVAVSEYQNVQYQVLEEKLRNFKINWYNITAQWVPMPKFNKQKNIYDCFNYSQQELMLSYFRCQNAKTCQAIINNRLYSCYRTAMLDLMGEYGFASDEYVDLTMPLNERKKAIINLQHKLYSEGCNYCGMGDLSLLEKKLIEPAEQLFA